MVVDGLMGGWMPMVEVDRRRLEGRYACNRKRL